MVQREDIDIGKDVYIYEGIGIGIGIGMEV